MLKQFVDAFIWEDSKTMIYYFILVKCRCWLFWKCVWELRWAIYNLFLLRVWTFLFRRMCVLLFVLPCNMLKQDVFETICLERPHSKWILNELERQTNAKWIRNKVGATSESKMNSKRRWGANLIQNVFETNLGRQMNSTWIGNTLGVSI